MIFTGNHNRRRAAQNGQNNAQRRRSSNVEARNKNSSRLSRDNSRESPSRSCYLPHSPSSSSSSSSYYSVAGTSNSYHSTYMTIPELDENKHDFFLQKTRARDITKRRGAIKLIQRLTYVFVIIH